MNKKYVSPVMAVAEMRIEKGFAASAADTFNIQQFEFDAAAPGNEDNTAW